MADTIYIPQNVGREEVYTTLLPQIESLVAAESDITANLANITAVLREALGFFWIGFYIVKDRQLILGPFQGTLACTRIAYGRGVCGTAWKEQRTIVVEDVDKFDEHIACSSASRSEIVVPILLNGEVVGVLDIDSDKVAEFDNTDKIYLEKLCEIAGKLFIQ